MTELNFTREIEQLRAEPAWQEFDRNAKRLVKNPELRVVLMTLKTGARLEKHVAPGASSIQVLAGHVRLNLPSESAELAAGELVAVAPAIRHDLEALETSAILLTIAVPEHEGGAAEAQRAPKSGHTIKSPAAETAPVRRPIELRAKHLSPDEQATLTEADLRPVFDTKPAGNCFAPIEGLKIVTSGKTDFRHHGWYVVEEPYAGMKPRTNHDEHPTPPGQRLGARIPGEVVPGETPVDLASESLIPPDVSKQNLSDAERSYPDLRHIVRGGPQMASR